MERKTRGAKPPLFYLPRLYKEYEDQGDVVFFRAPTLRLGSTILLLGVGMILYAVWYEGGRVGLVGASIPLIGILTLFTHRVLKIDRAREVLAFETRMPFVAPWVKEYRYRDIKTIHLWIQTGVRTGSLGIVWIRLNDDTRARLGGGNEERAIQLSDRISQLTGLPDHASGEDLPSLFDSSN